MDDYYSGVTFTSHRVFTSHVDSLSLLQAGLDPSGEGSATWVLHLHSALFSTSVKTSHKSSMLYFTTSIHLFLCLPLLRCPRTSASKILLTQSSSSRRCTCLNHLTLWPPVLCPWCTLLRECDGYRHSFSHESRRRLYAIPVFVRPCT